MVTSLSTIKEFKNPKMDAADLPDQKHFFEKVKKSKKSERQMTPILRSSGLFNLKKVKKICKLMAVYLACGGKMIKDEIGLQMGETTVQSIYRILYLTSIQDGGFKELW